MHKASSKLITRVITAMLIVRSAITGKRQRKTDTLDSKKSNAVVYLTIAVTQQFDSHGQNPYVDGRLKTTKSFTTALGNLIHLLHQLQPYYTFYKQHNMHYVSHLLTFHVHLIIRVHAVCQKWIKTIQYISPMWNGQSLSNPVLCEQLTTT